MPSTITGYTSFTALTKIKSAKVNENFSNSRGNLIPIHETTATAGTTGVYTVGTNEYTWLKTYQNNAMFAEYDTTTSAPTPDPGFRSIYVKQDDKIYSKDDAGTETEVRTGAAGSFDVVTKTANFTLTTSNNVVLADASTASFNLELPTAVGNEGVVFELARIDENLDKVANVNCNGAETVGYTTTTTLATKGEVLKVMSDNANWSILGRRIDSNFQSYDLTITATTTTPTKGTITDNLALWKRVGDSAIIKFDYRQTAAGVAGSGTYKFSIPNGLAIDTAKLDTNYALAIQGVVGAGQIYSNANGSLLGSVDVMDSTNLRLTGVHDTYPVRAATGSNNHLGNTEVRYSFLATVPIVGWNG